MSGGVSTERAARRIEGFFAWAKADAPLRNEWCMTRAEARFLADRLEAAERERDEARETKRELHRRTQQAESVAASVNGQTIARLDIELAEAKVERHKARQENGFMKNERKRLQSRLRSERHAAMKAESRAKAAEARVERLEEALRAIRDEAGEGVAKVGHAFKSCIRIANEARSVLLHPEEEGK